VPEVHEDLAETELALGIRPSTSGSTIRRRFAARSSVRISRHHADRNGDNRARAAQGAASGERRVASGDTVGLAFRGERLSLFDKASGARDQEALLTIGAQRRRLARAGSAEEDDELAVRDRQSASIARSLTERLLTWRAQSAMRAAPIVKSALDRAPARLVE